MALRHFLIMVAYPDPLGSDPPRGKWIVLTFGFPIQEIIILSPKGIVRKECVTSNIFSHKGYCKRWQVDRTHGSSTPCGAAVKALRGGQKLGVYSQIPPSSQGT